MSGLGNANATTARGCLSGSGARDEAPEGVQGLQELAPSQGRDGRDGRRSSRSRLGAERSTQVRGGRVRGPRTSRSQSRLRHGAHLAARATRPRPSEPPPSPLRRRRVARSGHKQARCRTNRRFGRCALATSTVTQNAFPRASIAATPSYSSGTNRTEAKSYRLGGRSCGADNGRYRGGYQPRPPMPQVPQRRHLSAAPCSIPGRTTSRTA